MEFHKAAQIKHDTCVPAFSSVAAFKEAMRMRRMQIPVDLYPRDGTTATARIESGVGRLIGVRPENVVAYSSGMSAIVSVIESQNPGKGDVVLHGIDEYSRTNTYISDILSRRGVRSVRVDASDSERLAEAIEKHRPGIIFLETVGNGPNVPVLDIERLFSARFVKDCKPLVVLDNTLATPTCMPPELLLRDGMRAVVVESGMKAYSRNSEMLGIAYTLDRELLYTLREERITRGYMPSHFQTEAINHSLAFSKEEFDSRNRKIFSNCLRLAEACAVGCKDSGIVVSHPNLDTHRNKRIAEGVSGDGVSPLFYIICSGGIDQFQLSCELIGNLVIRSLCELGQSFGFDRTRIFPDSNYPCVRISTGTEDEETALSVRSAFKEVIMKAGRADSAVALPRC